MRIALIGAGRAGTAVATALAAAGHPVLAVASRTPAQADRLARALPPATAVPAVAAAAADVDLLLLAVGDDQLAPLAAAIAPHVRPGLVVAHLSGAHGLAILQPVTDAGALPLALHPAMTFVGEPADAQRLAAGISFGVTAAPGAEVLAVAVTDALRGRIEWISEADRVLYHAALAHGANHLVTLVNDAADLARKAGVDDPAALLGPLLRAALGNALAAGDAALTGPVARGDVQTVRAHLATLAERAPALDASYRALATRTTQRAVAARPELGDAIARELAPEGPA